MDLPGASLVTVTNQIKQGYASGKWNGSGGITSASAAADTTHLTALGVIQNNQSGSALYNSFDGTSVGAGDILVKFTYYGDANLDGKVDVSDYSRIDVAYLNNKNPANTPLTGWYNGDFNYDGVINGSDYTLIDNAFNTQGAALTTQTAAPNASITAQIANASAVPEPAMISVLMTLGFLTRRREIQ